MVLPLPRNVPPGVSMFPLFERGARALGLEVPSRIVAIGATCLAEYCSLGKQPEKCAFAPCGPSPLRDRLVGCDSTSIGAGSSQTHAYRKITAAR